MTLLSTFNDLLDALGPWLRVLSMDVLASPNLPMNSGASYAHCASLRVLHLARDHNKLDLEPLLRACGHGLCELHMTGERHLSQRHVSAVTKWCTALNSLTLGHRSCNS